MTRKLATIETIKELKLIKDADMIELAIVRGWQCVVKKNTFKTGDKCVFFEIDSFLPIQDRYEFLRQSSYKKYWDGSKEGFKLKTIRLRKQISQGLAMPLTDFNDLDDLEIGTDITSILNVILYDPPIKASLAGMMKGNFPSFILKTDAERIQNLYDEYKLKYSDISFESSIKLDGSSMTCCLNNGEYGVCSRNWELKLDQIGNTFIDTSNRLNIEDKLRKLGRNIALQGELIGSGIQGNNEKITGQDYIIFNIYDIDKQRYLLPNDRHELLSQLGDLLSVPVLNADAYPLSDNMDLNDILFIAEGQSMNTNANREGVVYKSNEYVDGQVLSFKAISNKYLLKQKD